MNKMNIRLGITPCDAVVAGGDIHTVEKVNDLFVQIRALHGHAEPLSLTHQELSELVAGGGYAIEYGYFESRQVARRARAGRSLLSRLSTKSQLEAFWKECWCEAMLEAEQEGKFNRSAERWPAFLPELEGRVTEKLKLGLKQANPGAAFDSVSLRRSPCRTSAMAWLRDWEGVKDPMVFVKKSIFNGSNAKRVSAEVEAIIQRNLQDYLHPNQILPSHVLDAVNAEVREKNRVRALSGDPPLGEVSKSTIERRINELDRFEVLAARKGVAFAKNKLGAHGSGVKVEAPLHRVEMDEWEIDLMAILKSANIDITSGSLRDIETGRYWVCVAFDTASRSILGLKLSRKPSSGEAKAVLWMAMRDKTDLARRLGCKADWRQHGHIYHVTVDNGPAFVNAEFKAALSDLSIDYSVLPAGVPKLRGRVERVFRSVATQLMPLLTGRTHSNPQERGDYPSQDYAVHTAESIVELLVRFTVDRYHNRKHRALDWATPNIVWERLNGKFGWSPALNNHKLRHILGVALSRETGRHGVLVGGVNYHSERLAKHFLKFGPQTVDVRIDPEDMGHISVWFDGGEDAGWASLKAQIPNLEGVSFAAWEQVIFDLRQTNRNAAGLTQGIVDRAIKRIKEIDAEQRAMRQLGPVALTTDQIKRAERETFWGLSLGLDPERQVTTEDESEGTLGGLLSEEIKHDPASQPEDQPLQRDEEAPEEFWKFSDEEEGDDDA
ncbi:hypothetical protein GCM10016455_28420 [Aliiroseovarius zhejiangensis]|uniref:Integrase catalytic domain-containing protein n=1 Tax=Aliiroseovarius zhejiangensis TaxID=1632025 RepID=A0ABQ3J8S3_9RHOB|nr:Mu transposase C-terminal domain-containing protein [Aliiroseovarius zhejiangensis]GHF05461.1 hypothetical protein GCM10016455_28420 [Aliiroseovarius zhejiangensis]